MTQAWLLLLSAVLGAMTGFWQQAALLGSAQFIADSFKMVLEVISVPLIFLSIVTALSGMQSRREVASVGMRTLVYTGLTTCIAATVGLLMFLGINPSGHIWTVAGQHAAHADSSLSFMLSVIPRNMLAALTATGSVTFMVFLAFLLGVAILYLPSRQRQSTHALFARIFDFFVYLSQVLLFVMPVIVWAFMALFFASFEQQSGHLVSLGWYTATVLSANLLQGIVVLPLFLWLKGVAPRRLIAAFRPALTLAFISKSSNIALPVTIDCAQKAGIRPATAKFVLPLCSTINMNGCAAFILITVLFVATNCGVSITLPDMVAWLLVACVAAIGNAGVPMGCFFLTSAFLAHMKLPLTMMGMILPLYAFLDMVETALNVWSDSCVAAVVDADLSSSQH